MHLFSKVIGLLGFHTIGPSDYWAFGLLGIRTIGLSDYWTFGLLGFRTVGPTPSKHPTLHPKIIWCLTLNLGVFQIYHSVNKFYESISSPHQKYFRYIMG